MVENECKIFGVESISLQTMALLRPAAGTIIILAMLISTGVISANSPVTNSDGQENVADLTSTTKSNILEQSESYSDTAEQSTVSPTLPDNSTVSNVDSNIDAIPNNDSDVQNPPDGQDSVKNTTENKAVDTTQNPVKATTFNPNRNATNVPDVDSKQTSTDNISSKAPSTVVQNTTKSQAVTVTDSSLDKKNVTTTRHDTTTEFVPITFDTTWMNKFLDTHHFEGQYMFSGVRYSFDFVVRFKHPNDPKTLIFSFYDVDGAVLEFNGTSADGHVIVFILSRIYTPGVRFPLQVPIEVTGSFLKEDQPYFVGNFTQPINSSFSWFHMNKGLGAVETGEIAGTRTAIVIIIPTSIAFIGICGTIAIVCWASKKGYLRGRHKSYRLFTNAQVSYESEAETIHI